MKKCGEDKCRSGPWHARNGGGDRGKLEIIVLKERAGRVMMVLGFLLWRGREENGRGTSTRTPTLADTLSRLLEPKHSYIPFWSSCEKQRTFYSKVSRIRTKEEMGATLTRLWNPPPNVLPPAPRDVAEQLLSKINVKGLLLNSDIGHIKKKRKTAAKGLQKNENSAERLLNFLKRRGSASRKSVHKSCAKAGERIERKEPKCTRRFRIEPPVSLSYCFLVRTMYTDCKAS